MTRRTIERRTPHAAYDDGWYALDDPQALAPLTVTAADLPAMCGVQRGHGQAGDCPRLNMAVTLHHRLVEVISHRRQYARLRSPYRKANLGGWIEMAQRRLEHLRGMAVDLPECTCPPERRFAEPTRDLGATYPGCTC